MGHAGQSLGAWLCKGITLELEGDSNDYVGKVGKFPARSLPERKFPARKFPARERTIARLHSSPASSRLSKRS